MTFCIHVNDVILSEYLGRIASCMRCCPGHGQHMMLLLGVQAVPAGPCVLSW